MTTEELLERIDKNLSRLADAAERIALAMEPAENDDDPMTMADNLQAITNCISTEDGSGLCETISRAAGRIAGAKQAG
jgi:predicted Ser/Thr protein kinase